MDEIEKRTMGKVIKRLVPFLIICYFIAYLDRVNIGFAKLTMLKDLSLSETEFGLAAGIFFLSYFVLEVPSNLALDRFGARKWIARIMLTWGLIAGAQAWVSSQTELNVARFLLGAAEAGFFPGIIFFLTLWFPTAYRGRVVGLFMFAIPVSTAVGSPISASILGMEGIWGFHGWQWMFLIEAVPAVLLSIFVFVYLTDAPKDAKWLAPDEQAWLTSRLAGERAVRDQVGIHDWLQTMLSPRVLLLGLVYLGGVLPLYALSFFTPSIIKAFGLTVAQTGWVNAVPYALGAVGMLLWSRSSDTFLERKWHVVLALLLAVGGLALTASTTDSTTKFIGLCMAAVGVNAFLPIFWAFPAAFLSGAGAAAGIAAINSIGNLGGYLGPQAFGYLREVTKADAWGLITVASFAVLAIVIVFAIGHNSELERKATQAKAG